jgi:protein pelota
VRLLHQDPATGLLRLRIETPSDLWRVARLVRPGEQVGASTTRRDPEAPEDAPAAQRDRRRIWLVVRVEQVEFHDFSHHVRVTGPIVEGPFDIGRHHTLDLGEGEEFTVQKESLSSGERALLEEGLEARGEPTLVVAAVDWGDSAVVRLRGRSIEPVAELKRTLPGKRYASTGREKERGLYVTEVASLLKTEAPQAAAIVIVGPGFFKEQVAKELFELLPESRAKTKVMPASESGRAGIEELLRSGRASEVLRTSVAAEESALVESLLTELGGHRASVGIRETAEAVIGGAAETILVLDTLLTDAEVARILDVARAARARVFIVRKDGEPGRRLQGLGGIAARLRYEWRPTERAP